MLTKLEIKPNKKINSEPEILTTNNEQDLTRINLPNTQMVLWQRRLLKDLKFWLKQIDLGCLPNLRIVTKPKELKSIMHSLFDDYGMPNTKMRSYLIEDIEKLVFLFADIINNSQVDVRFESLDHDGCWKFHRDSVKTRLVTTYLGPTTEWVKNQSAEQALRSQREYQGPIEHFQTYEVGVFKGSRVCLGSGIVHRSPPISKSGKTRLLLCLNKPS
jgi:hypothetical protein